MANAYGISIDTTSISFAPLTDDAAILRQWVNLQFKTKLGFYWSAPEVGCDLQVYVLRGLTPDAIARLPAQIEAALGQDERIANVSVSATKSYTAVGAVQLDLLVTVTPKDTAIAAPFTLAAVASADIANKVTQGLGS